MEFIELKTHSELEAVEALLRGAAMSSKRSIVISRYGPSDRKYPRLGGRDVIVAGYESGQVVALVRVRVENYHDRSLLYVSDLRVAQSHQGQGISLLLIDEIRKILAKDGVRQGYFLVNDGNHPVFKAMGKLPRFQSGTLVPFSTKSFLLATRPPTSAKEFSQIIPDYQAACGLFANQSWKLKFSQEEWQAFLSRYPEIQFYGQTNKIEFALWNQGSFRQLSLATYSPAIQMIRMLWNLRASLFNDIYFPAAGIPWSSTEVCFVSPEFKFDQVALDFISRKARELGSHLVNVPVLPGRSYQRESFFPFDMQTKTFVLPFSLDGGEIPKMSASELPFVDLGFV